MPEVAHPARDYRLGDVVTGYVTRAHLRHPSTAPSRESTCERWPGTLACEYVSATPAQPHRYEVEPAATASGPTPPR